MFKKKRHCAFVLVFFIASQIASAAGALAPPFTNGSGQEKPEAISLLGKKLFATPPTGEALLKLQNALQEAQKKYEANPDDPENCILYGRALAGLWRYHEAIAVFTKGIEKHPDYAMLFRHRGHRYITIREFDKAVVDLTRASKLNDQDYDIWYHLGLAHYLKGEFAKAVDAYRQCDKAAKAEDSKISISNWLYIALRRLGKKDEAQKALAGITEGMKAGESQAYYNLLFFYKGLKTEQDIEKLAVTDLDKATMGYGVGCWHLYSGDKQEAAGYFEKIVELPYWPAFGAIAAEAELARLKK
jgi:tetratricopeptide (TPR) repeat protein